MREIHHHSPDENGNRRCWTEFVTEEEADRRDCEHWKRSMGGLPCLSETELFAELEQPGWLAILFLAVWSAPARMLAWKIPKIQAGIPDHLRFRVADLDRHCRLCCRFEVRSTELLVLCRDGEPVARLSGAQLQNIDLAPYLIQATAGS